MIVSQELLTGLRIALVFTPYKQSEFEVVLKETRKHLGTITPITIIYVAAILEAAGATVLVVDLCAEPLPPEAFLSRLRSFQPDYVGFTLTTYHFHHSLHWIRLVKNTLKTKILVGGTHFSIYPSQCLQHPEIDCGVIGDALGTVEPLLAALSAGKYPLDLPNVAFRRDGETVITPRAPRRISLDSFPFPARHLLQNDRYSSLISKRKNFTAMLSSRGCPFRCLYCENTYIKPDFLPAQRVVDEVEQCYRQFDIREIDFFDASFTTKKQRVHEICQEIQRRKLDISWSVRTRVDLVDEPMLQAMASAGCTRVYYGIESGVPEILKNLERTTDLTTVKRVVAATRRAGIAAFGYFMFGAPGETLETIARTVRFSKTIDLDYAMYSPVFTPPNTKLYALLMEQLGEDYWARFTIDEAAAMVLPRYGTTLTDAQIQQLVRRAFLSFYLRPRQVIRHLTGMRSLSEVHRAFVATMDIAAGFLRERASS